jgi:hypothetical protein
MGMAVPLGPVAGESKSDALRLDFDRRIKLHFHGAKVSSDGGLLPFRELDAALGLTEMADWELRDRRTGRNTQHTLLALFRQSVFGRLAGLNGAWIDRVQARRRSPTLILDIDSSESPVHGDQEGAAYNGYFGCVRCQQRARGHKRCRIPETPSNPRRTPCPACSKPNLGLPAYTSATRCLPDDSSAVTIAAGGRPSRGCPAWGRLLC